jgi:hypothetical protein
MRDPHVESLRYSAGPTGNTSYSNPPLLEDENDLYTLTLVDGELTIKPKDHFATVSQAREAIEPFLRAWELDADLRSGVVGAIRFNYQGHITVDRNPLPADDQSPKTLEVGATEMVWVAGSATLHTTSANYPKPPPLSFQITPDVDTMWFRYRGYREGREPLLSMAYFCLTVMEASVGRGKKAREKAGRRYNIHIDVLQKLGNLTARGDAKTARKVQKGQPLEPLTGAEPHWVDEAVKALIRRMGEYKRGQPISKLTMRDLPSLR